jgi:threonine dehydratase
MMMNARVKLTAIDEAGNAVCGGMDEVVEMDCADEHAILAGAKEAWVYHWQDDERVRSGEITVAAEIVTEDYEVTP